MSETSNTPYSALHVDSYPQSNNGFDQPHDVTLPESSSHLPYQHSAQFLQSPSHQSDHVNGSSVTVVQAITHALDAQYAPIIPINAVGSGAHDNCSPTCVLSHPRRSASIYVCILVAITCLVTGSLISLKSFRGNVPGAHVNPSAAVQTYPDPPAVIIPTTTSTYVSNLNDTFSNFNDTNVPVNNVPETVYDRLDRVFHSAAPTIQSANPKVPIDENDMTSSMLLLGWGLSPLLSAVITIAWTYLKYRKTIRVPESHSAELFHQIPAQNDLHRDVSELRLHHHHPMFVNPSPHIQSDTDIDSVALSASQLPPENDVVAPRQQSSSSVETVISPPPPSQATRSSTLGHSGLERPLLSPTRAISAPTLPASVAAARTLSAQGCPRPHRVAPFYSRPKKNRGWFWWIPRSRAQLSTLLRPFGRFMLRCYFIPIMVPTIGAVLQYAFSCCLGFTGFLSPVFVPTLTSALSLPSTKTAELWSVTLAFFYELFLGVWWDPFPPGSADWGRGMDFSGASWMAISAMEEIGWAGLLFPCLYEIWPKNPTRASIVTGLIWSAWHWPMLVFGQMNLFPEAAAYHPGLLSTPFFYGFVTFTLSTTFSRVIMVRLLLFSDDLWSQCVYHAAHNVMVFNFFAQLPDVDNSRYPHAGLFIAEAGIPLVTMYTSIALFIIYRWRTAERRKTRALAASHGITLVDGESISPVHHQIIDEAVTTEELQFYPRAKSPDVIQMQARNEVRMSLMSPVEEVEESPQYQSFSSRPALSLSTGSNANGTVQSENTAIDMRRQSVLAN